jgi:GNAT superfamily N-acetyltransferase
MGGELLIRPLTREDRPSVLALLSAELDWTTDSFGVAMFEWEHERGPLGVSRGWGAFDGDRLAGARQFMRWDFRDADGAIVSATRGMDMVVDPAYRRRGIASRITKVALEELSQTRPTFIFSTPNRGGYEVARSLGWVVLGTWPLAVRPGSLSVIRGLVQRRPASRRLPEVTSAGLAAGEVLAQVDEVEALLAARARPPALETHLSPAELAWRYGESPLHYRALLAGSRPRDGMVLFRIVRRGTIREARLCDMLVPADGQATAKRLIRRLAEEPGVDAIVRAGAALLSRDGFMRIPGSRITVVGKSLRGVPPSALHLRQGDLEVF